MQYNSNSIKKMAENDSNIEYILFWSHASDQPYGSFSQWAPSRISFQGSKFVNAEQAMMAAKASMFMDFGTLIQIMECVNPRSVKALGRQVRNYNEDIWDAVRLAIVTEINYAKFNQNPNLKELLLSTGNKIIVEASPYDRIWGIGLAPDHPDACTPDKWQGENLLGQALMIVRDRLR